MDPWSSLSLDGVLLRCAQCRDAVDVGDGDTPSWHRPLWDHLLDEHMDIVAVGRQASVEFRGPQGLTAYVRETRA